MIGRNRISIAMKGNTAKDIISAGEDEVFNHIIPNIWGIDKNDIEVITIKPTEETRGERSNIYWRLGDEDNSIDEQESENLIKTSRIAVSYAIIFCDKEIEDISKTLKKDNLNNGMRKQLENRKRDLEKDLRYLQESGYKY